MKLYFYLFILSVLSFACRNDKEEIQPVFQREVAYFPSEIGDYWEYEVFDKLQNSINKVNVSVVMDTIIQLDTFKIWQYTGHSGYDFELVRLYSDSVVFYTIENLNFIRKYKFPPNVYEKWTMGNQWDTAYYGGVDSVIIANNSYQAEMIYFNRYGFNYSYLDNVSIQKQVGIVKRTQREFNTWPSINEEWTLVDSNLLPANP